MSCFDEMGRGGRGGGGHRGGGGGFRGGHGGYRGGGFRTVSAPAVSYGYGGYGGYGYPGYGYGYPGYGYGYPGYSYGGYAPYAYAQPVAVVRPQQTSLSLAARRAYAEWQMAAQAGASPEVTNVLKQRFEAILLAGG